MDVPIQQAFENCNNFSRDSEKAKTINNKVTEFIALDHQPFSEEPGFSQDNADKPVIVLLNKFC